MKRLITLITLCFAVSKFNTSIAQYHDLLVDEGDYAPVELKTPNGSTVGDARVFTGQVDINLSSTELDALVTLLRIYYDSAQLVYAPTYKYNCHGYAWNTESNVEVWIGGNLIVHDVYWNDKSYVEVDERDATKVDYHQSVNHSAIRADSDWYVSKWRTGPVVKHRPNAVPYNNSDMERKYYMRTPTINGDNMVCDSDSSFSLSTGLYSSTLTWKLTGPFSFDSINPNVTAITVTNPTVYHTGASSGSGTLTASLDTFLVATKVITSCPLDILGSNEICPSATYTLDNNASASWSVSPSDSFTLSAQYGSSVIVTSPVLNGQIATLMAVAANGDTLTKTIQSCQLILAIIGLDGHPCLTPGTYTLVGGVADYWTVTNGFSILYSDSTSAAVFGFAGDVTTGILTAVVNGINVTRIVTSTCDQWRLFNVYPNPANDELIIDKIEDGNDDNINIGKSKTTIKVLLYSHSTTKLVFSQDYPSSTQQIKIDTSKLPNGVYYLNIIENGEKVKQQTIIVNH